MYNNKIQSDYKKLKDKKRFIIHLAEKLGKSPTSIQCNWFSNFCRIPQKYQNIVVDDLQNHLKQEQSELITH
jgi:hypothetical protein